VHKFILSFRGRIQKVFFPEAEQCLVGRKSDCDIQIDNLAIEPAHAVIHFKPDEVRMNMVNKNFHILINNRKPQNYQGIKLEPGDEITFGKHSLTYLWESQPLQEKAPDTTIKSPVRKSAWLQIMNGPKMGRTLQIDKPNLKIGSTSQKGALITSRNGGYYLSHLDNNSVVEVNNQDIGSNNVNLQNGNTIRVGDMEMLFYTQEL